VKERPDGDMVVLITLTLLVGAVFILAAWILTGIR
jgi:hypothetical protein